MDTALARRILPTKVSAGDTHAIGGSIGSPTELRAEALDTASSNSLRLALAEAQKRRSDLQQEVASLRAELGQLSARSDLDKKKAQELTTERAVSAARSRDRDEELKGKLKLLENLHDELVALTLQLNISEDQNAKLRKENKDLVDRWMARKGEEADAMNLASNF